MIIGLVSDSHDNLPMIAAALEAFRTRRVEAIIHAGDVIAPFAAKRFAASGVPVLAVYGNCDGETEGLAALLPGIVRNVRREELAGRRFVIVHSIKKLAERDRLRADVIVHGHTHEPEIKPGSPLVVNPGECCGYVNGRATAAVLDSVPLTVELIELGAE